MKRSALPFVRGRPVGARADVADAERVAGECVDSGAVRTTVVGHQPLHSDSVRAVERHRSAKETDDARGLLVGENLSVGESRCVVDTNVHELPASRAEALGTDPELA